MKQEITNKIKETYRTTFADEILSLTSAETEEQKADAQKALNDAIMKAWKKAIIESEYPALALANNAFCPVVAFSDESGLTINSRKKATIGYRAILKKDDLKAYNVLLEKMKLAYIESIKHEQDKTSLNDAFSALIAFSNTSLDNATVNKQVLRFALDTLKDWNGLSPKAINETNIDKSIVHAVARAVSGLQDVDAVFKEKKLKASNQDTVSPDAMEKALKNKDTERTAQAKKVNDEKAKIEKASTKK